MNNAIIYTRYSPRPEKEGDAERNAANEDAESIQLQLEVCQRYALMKGLAVSETIKDPETSARKTPLFEREGGWRLKHLPRGTHVIAMKLARLFRSAVDGLQTLEFFETRGIVVHFADEGGVSLSTNTAKGKLVTTMLLAVAEYEPGKTAERTSKAMKHRQSNGQRMTSAKTIPFGQMVDPNDSSRTIPCEHELYAIREAKELRDDGNSLRNIALALGPIRGRTLSAESVKKLISRAKELA
jgi:DNA invertase Pin-like site-specific DNA recombinase